MKFFKKEDLAMLIEGPVGNDWNGMRLVSDEPFEEHRWEMERRVIFEVLGAFDAPKVFYETFYRVGLTEMQETEPFSDDPYEIECRQVYPQSKTVTEYVHEQTAVTVAA